MFPLKITFIPSNRETARRGRKARRDRRAFKFGFPNNDARDIYQSGKGSKSRDCKQ